MANAQFFKFNFSFNLTYIEPKIKITFVAFSWSIINAVSANIRAQH